MSGFCSGGVCAACATNDDCGGNSDLCGVTCQAGICQTVLTEGQVCSAQGCGPGMTEDICCHNGTCSQVCSACS